MNDDAMECLGRLRRGLKAVRDEVRRIDQIARDNGDPATQLERVVALSSVVHDFTLPELLRRADAVAAAIEEGGDEEDGW